MRSSSSFLKPFRQTASITLSALIAISCGQQDTIDSAPAQIIGEDDRTSYEIQGLPPVLSVIYKDKHICNGGFVESNLFVTAKHCLTFSQDMSADELQNYSVSFKSSSFTFKTKLVKVSKIEEASDIVYLETEASFDNHYAISEPVSGAKAHIYSIGSAGRHLSTKGEITEEGGLIKYSMDTQRGTSGAPIFQDGKIVGIHVGACGELNCAVSLTNPPHIHGLVEYESIARAVRSFAEGKKYREAASQIEKHMREHPESREKLREKFKEYKEKAKDSDWDGYDFLGASGVAWGTAGLSVGATAATGGAAAPAAIITAGGTAVYEILTLASALGRPKPEILTPEEVLKTTDPSCSCNQNGANTGNTTGTNPNAGADPSSGSGGGGGGGGGIPNQKSPDVPTGLDSLQIMLPEISEAALGEFAASIVRENPGYYADTAILVAFIAGIDAMYQEESLGEELSQSRILDIAKEIMTGGDVKDIVNINTLNEANAIRIGKITIILNME